MKNLFKVAAVVVLSLGFGVAANAQTDGQATMVATANVLGAIEVAAPTALTFGQITPGFKKYISMTGDVQQSGNGTVGKTNESAGLFNVFAAEGSSISMELEITSFAHKTVQGATLPIDFNKGFEDNGTETTVAWQSAVANSTPVKMEMNGVTTITNFPQSVVNGKNGINVLVGGTVRPGSSQQSGEYEATITLTASYN